MRTYELRIYTLRSEEALRFYAETIYPRHLKSFPKFGVQAHGFWTAEGDNRWRLFVLLSYAEGQEPGEVAQRYLQSPELASDIDGFDVSNVVSVDSTILVPLTASPLI